MPSASCKYHETWYYILSEFFNSIIDPMALVFIIGPEVPVYYHLKHMVTLMYNPQCDLFPLTMVFSHKVFPDKCFKEATPQTKFFFSNQITK